MLKLFFFSFSFACSKRTNKEKPFFTRMALIILGFYGTGCQWPKLFQGFINSLRPCISTTEKEDLPTIDFEDNV